MWCLLICSTIGLMAGLILAIIDHDYRPLLSGIGGGVIAGLLATYFCNLGIQFFDAFTSYF